MADQPKLDPTTPETTAVANSYTVTFATDPATRQMVVGVGAAAIAVSLDGRRETVYSDSFVAAHLQLYFEPASQQDLLRRLAADYAWLPVGVPLVAALEHQGWSREYSGPISVVLARHDGSAAQAAPPISPACFPGP